MYDDGISNRFEKAHQKGLTRGFDLGWSYKGRFDRQIIRDRIDKLELELHETHDTSDQQLILVKTEVLKQVLRDMKKDENNREFIT